jgi:1-deoxy-D-xylulose-5-phosphate synthase
MVDGTGLAEFAKSYPDRIFDVGIAEEHAVTFAAGMAASGMRPIVAIYSTFMQRAYDQIMTDVCMQKLPVIFCIDRAGIVGADGETHHGIFDLSYMQHMPGMTILAPSDGGELRNMLEYAMTLDSPCTIRYPRGEVNEMTAEDTSEWKPVPRVIREGTDITVLAAGKMVERCLKAAETLSADISCEVIDARIIRPVLAETVDIYRKSAKKTKCIVTVEDNVIAGGFGSVIEEIFAADTEVRVYKVGWPDKFVSQGTQSELETRYGLDTAGIADKVRKIIEGKA